VPMSQVLLAGVSKGATAAMYHGLTSRLPFIAVDPILSETHYWENHGDSHFTRDGVFPRTKDEVFAELLARVGPAPTTERGHDGLAGALLTHPTSEQFDTVSAAGAQLAGSVATFVSSSAEIEKHIDVATNTTSLFATLTTALCYGWPIPPGRHHVA